MKRLLCFLLALGCSFALLGCTTYVDTPGQNITVYYRRSEPTYGSDDSIIAATTLETAENGEDYADLLQSYVASDPDEPFASTFPPHTKVVSFKLEALTGKIVLSDDFALLSGMDLTIACICLTQTVISLTGCQEVIISTSSSLLDGRNFITLSRDSYLLLDSSGIGTAN